MTEILISSREAGQRIDKYLKKYFPLAPGSGCSSAMRPSLRSAGRRRRPLTGRLPPVQDLPEKVLLKKYMGWKYLLRMRDQ